MQGIACEHKDRAQDKHSNSQANIELDINKDKVAYEKSKANTTYSWLGKSLNSLPLWHRDAKRAKSKTTNTSEVVDEMAWARDTKHQQMGRDTPSSKREKKRGANLEWLKAQTKPLTTKTLKERAVAEATYVWVNWYGTTKILTLGPWPKLIFEAHEPSKMAKVKDLINLCIMGGGRVHWENNTPPMSMPTSRTI